MSTIDDVGDDRMRIGEKYNWKCQPERLVYQGKVGCWHQFGLVELPLKVWCEVLEEDLVRIEKTEVIE